jgi:hypothetical protein
MSAGLIGKTITKRGFAAPVGSASRSSGSAVANYTK